MRCRCPRRAPSPGSVTSTTSSRSRRSSASRSSSSRRAAKACLEAAAQRVESHPGVAVAHLTQGLRQLGVAAEEANALLLELVRGPGSRDRAQRLGFEELDVHAAETTIGPVDALQPDTTGAGANPYDPIAGIYDDWSRRVTEDVDFYVQAAIAAGGPVVELGVGTGRIAIPTARAGIPVIGVDSSARMLDVCRQRATAPAWPASSTCASAISAGRRSASASGSSRARSAPTSTCTPTTSESRRLRTALALLEPGGRLVFDVFAPSDADIAETNGRWLEREPGIWERADWRPEERRLDLSVRGESGETTMPLAWLPPERWRDVLVRAGFERIECYGWFDRRRYRGGEDTVWIAQRPG